MGMKRKKKVTKRSRMRRNRTPKAKSQGLPLELSLRFGKSASKNFKRALSVARKLPGFTPADDKSSLNVLALGADDLRKHASDVGRLWGMIRS